ncbi:MAG: AMP-binding protein [Paracoccaceae bacterium]|nr:AMP-binding protein [Paracoccaceae bacterium]
MKNETVYKRFQAVANKRKDAPFLQVLRETALIYNINDGDTSYSDMQKAVNVWELKFRNAGYSHGQRVGLLLQNRPIFIEIWLALNSLGISVVPINHDLRVAELEYIIEHSEMKLIISTPERISELKQAISNRNLTVDVISTFDEMPNILEVDNKIFDPDTSTECALLYTSGTTGQPKGCILSNEYFLHSGDWYSEVGGLISLSVNHERMITPLPLFHMNAMAVSFTAMLTVGGCLIILDRFHPKTWWQSVKESKATCIHYLGVMPSILMNDIPDINDNNHCVRFGFGAGVDQKLHAKFEARFGFPLIEAWAMTETGSGGTISAHTEPRKIGVSCFGKPEKDIEIRIVDDDGQNTPTSIPGELLIRRKGPNKEYGFFSGYLKDERATNDAWANGWFHTGDIVKIDEFGFLYFIDRKKNIIRRSGENIAAVEVESILNRHASIKICAAAAAVDDIRGEEVAVFIILDKDIDTYDTAIKIVEWALDEMAYYKVPGLIEFVNELPLTATQKVRRGDLKKLVKCTQENNGFHDMRSLKRRQL